MPKIITTHVYPPIPVRTYDWSAHYDGEEECGEYGHGSTEDEAIEDLLANSWHRECDCCNAEAEPRLFHIEGTTVCGSCAEELTNGGEPQ